MQQALVECNDLNPNSISNCACDTECLGNFSNDKRQYDTNSKISCEMTLDFVDQACYGSHKLDCTICLKSDMSYVCFD